MRWKLDKHERVNYSRNRELLKSDSSSCLSFRILREVSSHFNSEIVANSNVGNIRSLDRLDEQNYS